MRWEGRRESTNVEDRRGMSSRMVVGGGIGTLLLAALIYFMGGDPRVVLNQAGPTPSSTQSAEYRPSPEEQKLASFVKVVVASNEDVWGRVYAAQGKPYRNPQLVLYSGQVASACGMASAAMGPFYCPGDQKLYLDLNYLGKMEQQLRSNVSFKKAGDFALAYIVAHEFGHHIQTLMGISDALNKWRQQMDARSFNQRQVRFELQADCLAGVWAHDAEKSSPGLLEIGDIENAIKVANVVGDDRIQGQLQGRVRPDTFTHGTSEQRMSWFYQGYRSGSGNLGACNTFQLPDPQF
ncbi:MAG: neutral zinc metallopeptidase [Deltaproteobacteria bacterium]|nr:neutral zinc metallopeptidase [Deltaproteobacteria bacterium]